MSPFEGLLNGATVMGYVMAAMFFIRFWTKTHDRLFVSFAIAFCLFAVSQAFHGLSGDRSDSHALLYLPRLGGFVLIIFAIAQKNWQHK